MAPNCVNPQASCYQTDPCVCMLLLLQRTIQNYIKMQRSTPCRYEKHRLMAVRTVTKNALHSEYLFVVACFLYLHQLHNCHCHCTGLCGVINSTFLVFHNLYNSTSNLIWTSYFSFLSLTFSVHVLYLSVWEREALIWGVEHPPRLQLMMATGRGNQTKAPGRAVSQ